MKKTHLLILLSGFAITTMASAYQANVQYLYNAGTTQMDLLPNGGANLEGYVQLQSKDGGLCGDQKSVSASQSTNQASSSLCGEIIHAWDSSSYTYCFWKADTSKSNITIIFGPDGTKPKGVPIIYCTGGCTLQNHGPHCG